MQYYTILTASTSSPVYLFFVPRESVRGLLWRRSRGCGGRVFFFVDGMLDLDFCSRRFFTCLPFGHEPVFFSFFSVFQRFSHNRVSKTFFFSFFFSQ